jgi:hypothetical protein
MLNRFSAVWLVVGLIGGYALSGMTVTAQSSDNLFVSALSSGSTVDLGFEGGALSEGVATITCTVAQLQGRWVRCKAADSFQDGREQQWYSLERVVSISKRQK